MKHIISRVSFAGAALLLSGSLFASPIAHSKIKHSIAIPVKPQVQLPTCPDLAAKLDISDITRNADGSYQFKLWATITNNGNRAYQALPNQQVISLSQQNLGTAPQLLAELPLTRLVPGARFRYLKIISRVNLSTEFLPGYSLRILYGPDAALRNSAPNYDCNRGNNFAQISGEQVRRQLNLSGSASRLIGNAGFRFGSAGRF